jgi:MFS family permease
MAIYLTFILTLLIITSVQAGRVLITIYALKLGAQPFTVGVLAALFSVLPTLLAWQVGRYSDRFGSRWLMISGTAGGVIGMLLPNLFPGLPSLYAAAVMNGLLFGLAGGAPLQNLVGILSRPEDRAKNFSNYSLLISLAGFLGPLLAGFSLDHIGPGAACVNLALLSLIPLVFLAIWGGILPGGTRSAAHSGSVREMLSESGLWRVMATSSLVITGIDLFQIYMPIYSYGIGLSASAIGVALAMYSVAAFAVRLVLPQLVGRLTVEKVLAYSFLIGAAGFMLVPLFKNIVILSLLSFCFGVGMGCGQPITLMMTFSSSAEGRSGEAMGIRVTVNHLTRVIVPVVFGSIGSAFGLIPVFWLNSLMLVSGSFASHPRIAALRHKKP